MATAVAAFMNISIIGRFLLVHCCMSFQPVTQSVEQFVRWTAIPASTLKVVKQGQCASAGVCKNDPIKTL
jgi:hypothetical protein